MKRRRKPTFLIRFEKQPDGRIITVKVPVSEAVQKNRESERELTDRELAYWHK